MRSLKVGYSQQEFELFCPSLFREMHVSMRLRLWTCHRCTYCLLRTFRESCALEGFRLVKGAWRSDSSMAWAPLGSHWVVEESRTAGSNGGAVARCIRQALLGGLGEMSQEHSLHIGTESN